jgi:hypothetical protein
MALIGSVNGIPLTKGGGDVATNTGVGTSTLVSNTNGNNNTALGYQALDSNTTGFENVAVGSNAAAGLVGGSRNTIVGNNAGASLTSGTNNTFVGGNGASGGSGEAMTTGSKNTIVGGFNGNQSSLDIRTASNRIVVSDGDGVPKIYNDSAKTWHAGPVGASSIGGNWNSTTMWSGSAVFGTTASATQTFTFSSPGSSFALNVTIGAYASSGAGSFVRSIVDAGHPGGTAFHHSVQVASSTAGYTLGTLTETAGGFTFTVTSPAQPGTLYVIWQYIDDASSLPTFTFA